ncbi:MAG: DinB family protein [Planctomycetaceae bacterium]|nr:DinB family protein [Planctomycetaceae bacterium]
MNTKEALRATMDMSLHVLDTYISDLSDADLMARPSKDSNHLAWQLGHLINAEVSLLESVCPGQGAVLPDGFAERHSKETCASDDASSFLTKQEYTDLYQKVRASTLVALEELPDADLDLPSPEWIREKFPSVGHLFALIGCHPMMHVGQFAIVRRELGKPVLI